MCGRYYVNDTVAQEFRRIVREAESMQEKFCRNATAPKNRLTGSGKSAAEQEFQMGEGDIHPSGSAVVLTGRGPGLTPERMRWGFPQYRGAGLVINARAETVLERKMFCDSVQRRRCVVPAHYFYEWDRDRNKAMFSREDSPVIFMAGFYDQFQGADRFVIITVPANGSVSPVHDRMPLILEERELADWIYRDEFLETALRRTPPFLKRRQEYEQQSLFDLMGNG